jgi:hypothetical protein
MKDKNLKMTVSRDVAQCCLINVSEVLTASITIALMMEAVNTSETSVNFYHTSLAKSQKTVVIFILVAVRT